MYSWAELSNKFDVPTSQKKTYALLAKAVGNWFRGKCISSCHNFEYIKLKDGTPIMNFSRKKIYNLMNDSDKKFNEVNQVWGLNWSNNKWHLIFELLWHSHVEPKKVCFKWIFLLKKHAIGHYVSQGSKVTIVCDVCNCVESYEHLFFKCPWAIKYWSTIFGVNGLSLYGSCLSWQEILDGYVNKFYCELNDFWIVLTSKVLWFIWRQRNEDIFQGKKGVLSEFKYKLTQFVIMSQVLVTRQIPKERSHSLLKEGVTLLFAKDIQKINEVEGTQIEAPRYNEPTDYNTIIIEEDKSMEPQIIEWNRNTTKASGEDASDLATEGHWNTSPHREYVEQGDEDGWS